MISFVKLAKLQYKHLVDMCKALLSSLVDSSSKVTYIFLTTNKKKEF